MNAPANIFEPPVVTDTSRREFLKQMARYSAITAAALLVPGVTFETWAHAALPTTGLTWKKTPCRFCGVGCGLKVGVSNGRAVAVKGDPDCEVNRGLCCVKGYHSVMAL